VLPTYSKYVNVKKKISIDDPVYGAIKQNILLGVNQQHGLLMVGITLPKCKTILYEHHFLG